MERIHQGPWDLRRRLSDKFARASDRKISHPVGGQGRRRSVPKKLQGLGRERFRVFQQRSRNTTGHQTAISSATM